MRCAAAWPPGVLRSSARLRLLRLALRKTAPWPPRKGGQPRVSSPAPGGSIFTTSAPRSPSHWPHKGPARTLEKSRTRTPASGVTSVGFRLAEHPLGDEGQHELFGDRRDAGDHHLAQQ